MGGSSWRITVTQDSAIRHTTKNASVITAKNAICTMNYQNGLACQRVGGA